MEQLIDTWKRELKDLKRRFKSKKDIKLGHKTRIMKLEGLVKGYETCDKQWLETMEILSNKEIMDGLRKSMEDFKAGRFTILTNNGESQKH